MALALLAGALGATPVTADGVEPAPGGIQCVGDPPRQTADPLSPPCVPFFEGDNGCETYPLGVTCNELRIVVYLDGGIGYASASDPSNAFTPQAAVYDLWKTPAENAEANGDPATTSEHLTVKGLRTWQDYFAQRFQTYGRAPHVFVAFSDPDGWTPEGRRRDAATVLEYLEPFAALNFATEDSAGEFTTALARKGVVNFAGPRPFSSSALQAFPRLIWSFAPSVEQIVANYGDYVCTKVVNGVPVLAGDDIQQRSQLLDGGRRKLGLLRPGDPDWPGLIRLGELVHQRVEGCGGEIAATAAFPDCCLAQDNGEVPEYALAQMTDFKLKGVTTILWAGGVNGNYGKAAALLGYEPEWIVAGDGFLDSNRAVTLSQSTAAFDGRAIVVTPEVVEGGLEDRWCAQAFREIDTETASADLAYVCEFYRDLHQLFVGVQVAGPFLSPTTLTQGFRAVPTRGPGEPDAPACFYPAGDFSCVKDAQAEIWDATGIAPGASTPGCWRAIEGGRRYMTGTRPWPEGNIDAELAGDEPCNGYSRSIRFNLT
ncbi:MAG TPA: hypothetical protein VI916_11415 [Acidimicrobiia bacterium]|nr:hypothetical protein [Acidimicrobiia bacterium]